MAQEIIQGDAETLERERAETDHAFTGLAAKLTGGIVVLTGLLTAIGGYTGGVARIMRNDPLMVQGLLEMVFVAVVFALVAMSITHHSRVWKLQGQPIRIIRLVLLAASVWILFSAVAKALDAATLTVTETADRPALSAQLVENEMGAWSVTGNAETYGLSPDDRMQVLVYGVLPDTDEPQRILFVTTGPDPDGVASESFEAPIPHRLFEAIVVTTSNGNLPRDCGQNRAFFAESDPTTLTQVEEGGWSPELPTTCLTFAPPPDFPPQ